MRLVCAEWKAGLDAVVPCLAITKGHQRVPQMLALRFPSLATLDLLGYVSAIPVNLACLQSLPLTSLAMNMPLGALTEENLVHLRGLRLTWLDLRLKPGGGSGRASRAISDADLRKLAGLPLVRLDLSQRSAHGAPATLVADLGPDPDLRRMGGIPLERLSLSGRGAAPEADPRASPDPEADPDDGSGSSCGAGWADGDLAPLRGMPLSELSLSAERPLTDAGLGVLAGMPLTHLRLPGKRTCCGTVSLAGVLAAVLPAGAPLQLLALGDGVQVSDAALGLLGSFPLTDLALNTEDPVTDAGLRRLTGMPLTALVLAGERTRCKISADGFGFLRGAPLRRLILGVGIEFSDPALEILRGMALTELAVSVNSPVTSGGLTALHNMPLTSLTLAADRGCCRVTAAALGALLWKLPLQCLTVGAGIEMKDEAMHPLYWKSLKKLELQNCRALSSDGFQVGRLLTAACYFLSLEWENLPSQEWFKTTLYGGILTENPNKPQMFARKPTRL